MAPSYTSIYYIENNNTKKNFYAIRNRAGDSTYTHSVDTANGLTVR
jgi:hypothetical protein